MSDIIERLLDAYNFMRDPLLKEAADEIERLRVALRYYAKNHYPDVNAGPWGVNSTDFGDVARAALTDKGEKP